MHHFELTPRAKPLMDCSDLRNMLSTSARHSHSDSCTLGMCATLLEGGGDQPRAVRLLQAVRRDAPRLRLQQQHVQRLQHISYFDLSWNFVTRPRCTMFGFNRDTVPDTLMEQAVPSMWCSGCMSRGQA